MTGFEAIYKTLLIPLSKEKLSKKRVNPSHLSLRPAPNVLYVLEPRPETVRRSDGEAMSYHQIH